MRQIQRLGRVLFLRGALAAEECKALLFELSPLLNWEPAATLRPTVTAARGVRRADVAHIPETTRWPHRFLLSAQDAIAFLRDGHLLEANVCINRPYVIRYDVGGEYPPHQDTHPDRPERLYTLVWYLNSDFRGGQTTFPEQGFSVLPHEGMLLCFPSRYLHAGLPVLSGTKLIATATLDSSGPPIAWI